MSDSASDTMNLFGIVRSLGDIRNTTNGSKFPRNATIVTKSLTKVPITIRYVSLDFRSRSSLLHFLRIRK